MSFTDLLYLETKDSHKQVDKHPFVSMIRKDKLAGEIYINFNKICIYKIQEVLKLNDINLENILHLKNTDDDIYVICSKNTKRNYELMISKIEDKLLPSSNVKLCKFLNSFKSKRLLFLGLGPRDGN